MMRLPIVFVLIRSMPAHEFGILRVSEQTPQVINNGEVPHHHSRNLFQSITVYFFFFLCSWVLNFVGSSFRLSFTSSFSIRMQHTLALDSLYSSCTYLHRTLASSLSLYNHHLNKGYSDFYVHGSSPHP
jgi:hypothetical protein